MSSNVKRIMPFLVVALLSMASTMGYTAVFRIVPKAGTSLPTNVTVGVNVNALYTLTNTTGRSHSGNYVKYLPPNTTQVTVDATAPELCGAAP